MCVYIKWIFLKREVRFPLGQLNLVLRTKVILTQRKRKKQEAVGEPRYPGAGDLACTHLPYHGLKPLPLSMSLPPCSIASTMLVPWGRTPYSQVAEEDTVFPGVLILQNLNSSIRPHLFEKFYKSHVRNRREIEHSPCGDIIKAWEIYKILTGHGSQSFPIFIFWRVSSSSKPFLFYPALSKPKEGFSSSTWPLVEAASLRLESGQRPLPCGLRGNLPSEYLQKDDSWTWGHCSPRSMRPLGHFLRWYTGRKGQV